MRRNKLPIILLALLMMTGCGRTETHEMQFGIMFDTVGGITVAGGRQQAEACRRVADDSLKRSSQLFDIYTDYDGIANLKTINANAGKAPVKVDRQIIDLLLFGKKIHELTLGKVNIAFGSVLTCWHDARDKAELPDRAALTAAAKHTDIESLIINEADSTVYISDPHMSLDVGAIAKGFAVQRAAEEARSAGYDSFLINMGGNVYAAGGKASKPWRVGIKNPLDTDALIDTLSARDTAVVTSGVYERFFEVGGRRYHHIIDPVTLEPSEYSISATVTGPDSAMADALSTAMLLLPAAEAIKLADSIPHTSVMLVDGQGNITESKSFGK